MHRFVLFIIFLISTNVFSQNVEPGIIDLWGSVVNENQPNGLFDKSNFEMIDRDAVNVDNFDDRVTFVVHSRLFHFVNFDCKDSEFHYQVVEPDVSGTASTTSNLFIDPESCYSMLSEIALARPDRTFKIKVDYQGKLQWISYRNKIIYERQTGYYPFGNRKTNKLVHKFDPERSVYNASVPKIISDLEKKFNKSIMPVKKKNNCPNNRAD